jgi:hypothetical protein
VIADKNIGFSPLNIFSPIELITDKREHAEDPAPDPQEGVADAAKPEKKGKSQPWKKDDHEYGKHQEDPKNVELMKEGANDFQILGSKFKILSSKL